MSVAIAIFARAPVAGEAKTRLIPRLGAEGAAALQHALIQHALRSAVAADIGRVGLWCAPDCQHTSFTCCAKAFPVSLHAQVGADLGARMLHAFTQLCGPHPALLIGTDCPALTIGDLRAAADALRSGDDAVLMPAEDGGYVLIGLHRATPAVFEGVAWGTGDVVQQTRDRLRRAAMRWHELPTSWDVDRPEDVDRLWASGLIAEIRPSVP